MTRHRTRTVNSSFGGPAQSTCTNEVPTPQVAVQDNVAFTICQRKDTHAAPGT